MFIGLLSGVIKDSLRTSVVFRPHSGSDFPGTEDKVCGLLWAGNGAPTPVMVRALHRACYTGSVSALAHLRKINL